LVQLKKKKEDEIIKESAFPGIPLKIVKETNSIDKKSSIDTKFIAPSMMEVKVIQEQRLEQSHNITNDLES